MILLHLHNTIVLYTLHNIIVFINNIVILSNYYNMNNATRKSEGWEVREG